MKKSEKTSDLLIEHYREYPCLQIADIFKYLHQSAFGCEHAVSSLQKATDNIYKEYDRSAQNGTQDLDMLDGSYSRVHLSYLTRGLSVQTLAKLFFASAKNEEDGVSQLEMKLDIAKKLVANQELPFSPSEFESEVAKWRALGYPPIHHSDAFRESYKPSYRVISNKYIPFLPVFAKIDEALKDREIIVAIEGGSASGKSTLGDILCELYDCTVLHTDDFFLRPEQRTKERYAEVGGNIDRERFIDEVLISLRKREPISYRRFDCSTLTLSPPKTVKPERLTVIEGAYSMHPAFDEYYDLSVFLDITPELQKKRIAKRNSPQMAERFFNEWIPLEERYFSETQIKARSDISIVVAQ